MVETKKERSLMCSRCFPLIFLFFLLFFIGSMFMVADHKEYKFDQVVVPKFLACDISKAIPSESKGAMSTESKGAIPTESKVCEHECRPDGSEALPRRIVHRTTDLEMRSLLGSPVMKRKPRMSLLAIAVGIKQKKNVDKIVKKFPLSAFAIMLFHYDGNVDGWGDLEWSENAIHVSAINQTKWWFAKRFLHPNIVAEYDYIFLWDEDLGVQNFHAGRYLSIVRHEGLQISQPAIEPGKSEVHYKLTAREKKSRFHRRTINLSGPGRRCYENSNGPPCTGFVEMMAPVFSKSSWRCTWHMIQNDLVHAWGLDFQLGYCAQGNRTENIGIVDSEYVIHLALPTLGGSADDNMRSSLNQSDGRNAVRKESYIELDNFKNRWRRAAKEDKCWVDPFDQTVKEKKTV